MTRDQSLAGRRIAVPESRQLGLFTTMLKSRGAQVQSCPLIAIHDAPDPRPVVSWLRDFAAGHHDDVILLTGEGVRRLADLAQRTDRHLQQEFITALGGVRTITRGPKPARALRDLGIRATLPAAAPTTVGVIETLSAQDLKNRVVGIQLYGTDPNDKLMHFLERAGAYARPVSPYVYADAADDGRVIALIESLTAGDIDAIAFTSSAQVKRLFSVARRNERQDGLQVALEHTVVAAVGPLTAQTLQERGATADLVPEARYFMKPLVRSLVERLSA